MNVNSADVSIKDPTKILEKIKIINEWSEKVLIKIPILMGDIYILMIMIK